MSFLPSGAAAAADLIPIMAYDPPRGLFYGGDGTLSFGAVCHALPGGDDKTEGRFRTLLEEDWPDDTILQFSLIASPNLVREFHRIAAARGGAMEGVLGDALKARLQFFQEASDRGFAECGGVFLRDFQVIFTAKIPIAGTEPNEAELDSVSQLRSRAINSLGHGGFAPVPIDGHRFVEVLSTYLNRSDSASWRIFGGDRARDDVPLNRQVFDKATDLRVDRAGLWLDDVRVSILSAKQMPEFLQWGLGAQLVGDMLHGTRGLRSPFFVTLSLHYPNQQSTRMKFNGKRQWVTNSAFGPMGRLLPTLATQKRDLDTLTTSMDNGFRPIRFALTLCLYSRPADPTASFEERLRSAEQQSLADQSNARTYWSEAQLGLMPDRFVCLPLFVNALPFCADRRALTDIGRYRSGTTEHATRLLPAFADWRGTGRPALNLISRNGQLMNVCLFDSSTNYNTVIAAESGSGKSFLANNLIESYLSMGAYVWVIDAGYSYVKLAEEFGGEYLDFNPEKKEVSLNPFPIVQDYDEEGDILEAVLTAMAAPSMPLSDLQSSGLRRVMRELWSEKAQRMAIDDIAARLLQETDERLRDVGSQLYQFTTAGAFGRYVHGRNTVDFRSRFTVLELDHLRSRKHLQQVVLLMLIYAIQQQMYRLPRGVKKLVLIDEAWELLGEGEVGKFIEFAYRRFRKYNGAAITITQSIADFHATESGKAIAANSANMFLLGQKSEVVDTLVAENKLALPPFSVEVLKSVHTLPGQYSEVYVKTESGAGVGRLIVPPFSRLLYSTRPPDLEAIAQFKERGLSTVEAIHAVIAARAGATGKADAA